ncbi:MAG: hypothetical protein U0234_05420 [Sandaracinus sp.]
MRLHALAAALLATALVPATQASAQSAPMFAAFGSHGANSNLVTQPIGATDCPGNISFTFSPVNGGTNRYIEIWSASSTSGNCQTHTNRQATSGSTQPVCTHVAGITYTPVGTTATVDISPQTLFGSCSTNSTRTFYFFDSASSPENTQDFSPYWVITIQLSANPPTAPQITSTPAGDEVIEIPWNASSYTSSLGTMGHVYVFADRTGCGSTPSDGGGADAGTGTTTTLVSGGAAPSTSTAIASPSATSPISVNTSTLGWTSANYGESAAIAIAVADSAGNISPLSNVVCVQHVHVTGFWEQYCASRGMTDTTACADHYRGCAVATPSRRRELTPWLVGLAMLGVWLARRRSR